jgi:hypothetical protein
MAAEALNQIQVQATQEAALDKKSQEIQMEAQKQMEVASHKAALKAFYAEEEDEEEPKRPFSQSNIDSRAKALRRESEDEDGRASISVKDSVKTATKQLEVEYGWNQEPEGGGGGKTATPLTEDQMVKARMAISGQIEGGQMTIEDAMQGLQKDVADGAITRGQADEIVGFLMLRYSG